MVTQINWTDEAQDTFDENINYLLREWSSKEVSQFVTQTNKVLQRIAIFPESYPIGMIRSKYRRAKINNYIVLFYSYHKRGNKVTLYSFWNIKQDPNKLKY